VQQAVLRRSTARSIGSSRYLQGLSSGALCQAGILCRRSSGCECKGSTGSPLRLMTGPTLSGEETAQSPGGFNSTRGRVIPRGVPIGESSSVPLKRTHVRCCGAANDKPEVIGFRHAAGGPAYTRGWRARPSPDTTHRATVPAPAGPFPTCPPRRDGWGVLGAILPSASPTVPRPGLPFFPRPQSSEARCRSRVLRPGRSLPRRAIASPLFRFG